MKNVLIIIISLIIGYCAEKFSMLFTQYQLNMSKLSTIKVIDGDTIHTINHGNIEKIRLLNIDCHETSHNPRAEFQSKIYKLSLNEIYKKGEEEKIYLKKLISDNKDNIYLKRYGIDKYGRTLGILYIGRKININNTLLEKNICPPYVNRF